MHPQPYDIEQEAARTVLPVVGALVAEVAAASLALWHDNTAVALARVTGVALEGLGLLRGSESVRSAPVSRCSPGPNRPCSSRPSSPASGSSPTASAECSAPWWRHRSETR